MCIECRTKPTADLGDGLNSELIDCDPGVVIGDSSVLMLDSPTTDLLRSAKISFCKATFVKANFKLVSKSLMKFGIVIIWVMVKKGAFLHNFASNSSLW